MRNARPHNHAEPGANQKKRVNYIRSPRERRLLAALLERPITREQADRIARASNSPDVVFKLRSHGIDVQMTRIGFVDADGRASNYGRYWLKQSDKRAAR